MDQEYRYPLTRICLRNGALTLPRTMLGLFPSEGRITAVDTRRDEEFELVAEGPRTVSGLQAFFDAHDLDVNDELLIRPLEDGRYAITPMPRARKPDYARPKAIAALLDELAEAELTANETELRALYPDLPADFDLRGVLEADDRFVFFEGRWHARAAIERRIDEEEAARTPGRPVRGASDAAGETPAEAAEAVPVPVPRARAADAGAGHAEPGSPRQDALWASTWQESWRSEATPAWSGDDAAAGPPPQNVPGTPTDDERSAAPSVRERRAPQRAVFPGDAALTHDDEDEEVVDLQQVSRARELLQAFGFRVESIGHGQLMAHAELGRRGYTVLVHALGFGQRLDWAALLARRREAGARYLAVFGDRRDLQRLQAPSELARATLWSWDGLLRARTLSESVPVSPFDLEVHFEREGLFGHGLERFEATVAGLVAERGAFSEVLSHLAGLRAPTVFLLEDLAGGGTLSRDAVLKILERLSDAPFHMVARVGQGEFCLRLPVGDGLKNLADYASTLRGRLPSRGRERLTGLGEPEWIREAAGADAEAETDPDDGTASDPDDGLEA